MHHLLNSRRLLPVIALAAGCGFPAIRVGAVRDSRYEVIRYPQINHTQLFDLDQDPDELKNLAGESGQAERVQRMMKLLEGWQRRTRRRIPSPWRSI